MKRFFSLVSLYKLSNNNGSCCRDNDFDLNTTPALLEHCFALSTRLLKMGISINVLIISVGIC